MTPSTGMSDEDDWRNPNVSLKDKLNRHIDKKKKSGVITHGSQLNTFVPWFFLFEYIGGSAWIVVGAIPHHYDDSPARLLLVECFAVYVVIQVLINWLLTCYTVSPYMADSEKAFPEKDNIRPPSPPPNDDNVIKSSTPSTVGTSHERTGLTYRVMVVTSVSGNKPERQSMPYWSWVSCFKCRRLRPPRCHHCTICNHCVLKRDHHCYFTRNCVGIRNQCYFMYFLVWCVVLCSICCLQLLPYIFQEVIPKYSYSDLIFPYNMYRSITGQLPFLYCHLIIVTWGIIFLTFISIGMFVNSSYLMLKGLTKFESNAGIKVIDIRSPVERVRSVMGQNWVVGLFIPGAAAFSFVKSRLPESFAVSDPIEDPVEWPYIKP